MLRATAQMLSLTAALAITSVTASALSQQADPTRVVRHCLCFQARPYFVRTERYHDELPLLSPVPVRLLRPHRPAVRPPELVCEMPGDPTAVTPCDQAPIDAG